MEKEDEKRKRAFDPGKAAEGPHPIIGKPSSSNFLDNHLSVLRALSAGWSCEMKVMLIDAAVTERLPAGMTLQMISARYLGERPDGLNIKLAERDGVDLQELMSLLRERLDSQWKTAVYHSTTAAHIAGLLGELDLIRVKPKRDRSLEETVLAISIIDFLQRIGHLKPDEFNGILLYAADEKLPVTELMNVGKRR
jgi:hypothetical protein